MISCRDLHCFSNTVIGLSFRVCLGAEELEQWVWRQAGFLANLPTHATRASRSPRFRPSSLNTQKSRLFCRLKAPVRSDVTTWRRAFLLWKKPEGKKSKMADVQFRKMTTDFELFSSLSKGKIYFFLLFTSNLSYFNSFKLPHKIRLLAFRSPLVKGGGGGRGGRAGARAGARGIGGVFDVRRLPVAEALNHCGLWVGTFDFNR